MNQAEQANIWYRQPMVWLLIAFPLTSVILGVVLIVLAVNTSDGLVVDDYYKQGLEINRTLARDARARELALRAEIEISAADNRVSLRLSSSPEFQAPARLMLNFHHATRAGEDQAVSMRRDARGVYTAPRPDLAPGRWYVSTGTPEWRLTRAIDYPSQAGFTLGHRRSGGNPG